MKTIETATIEPEQTGMEMQETLKEMFCINSIFPLFASETN
jgi:hypothetical protein